MDEKVISLLKDIPDRKAFDAFLKKHYSTSTRKMFQIKLRETFGWNVDIKLIQRRAHTLKLKIETKYRNKHSELFPWKKCYDNRDKTDEELLLDLYPKIGSTKLQKYYMPYRTRGAICNKYNRITGKETVELKKNPMLQFLFLPCPEDCRGKRYYGQ